MQRVKESELGDVVLVDADKNFVSTEYDDLEDLPDEIVSSFLICMPFMNKKVHTCRLIKIIVLYVSFFFWGGGGGGQTYLVCRISNELY